MKILIHGIRHELADGISTANLIEQLNPSKVLVERSTHSDIASDSREVMPICCKCTELNIPIIPFDKYLTFHEWLKALIFLPIDGLVSGIYWFVVNIIHVFIDIDLISAHDRYSSHAPKILPFATLMVDEREKHFIKVINRENVGDGLMLVVTGLSHVKSLRRHLNNTQIDENG